eukprot:3137150-Prymnesium_polylepis.1
MLTCCIGGERTHAGQREAAGRREAAVGGAAAAGDATVRARRVARAAAAAGHATARSLQAVRRGGVESAAAHHLQRASLLRAVVHAVHVIGSDVHALRLEPLDSPHHRRHRHQLVERYLWVLAKLPPADGIGALGEGGSLAAGRLLGLERSEAHDVRPLRGREALRVRPSTHERRPSGHNRLSKGIHGWDNLAARAGGGGGHRSRDGSEGAISG